MLPERHEILRRGTIEVRGRLPWSSNATFLARVCLEGAGCDAVYKPLRGERPLWDFPRKLYRREVAAYELSEALSWGIVPFTVEVEDAPLGEGSLQEFIDAELEQHYFTLYDDRALHDQLRTICAFDVIANNTDRKSGHCLLDRNGKVWAIDNGLSFHREFKLRTVIWEFAGEPLPASVVDSLATLVDHGLPASLDRLLDLHEREAVVARARALLDAGTFPTDPTGRRYPWPLV
ncbi:SCO1664 family protein [Rhabdothermincola sediminis]|uniref:SCO1664 family protein n=1 Tax=Rhabdothermincola sediminis TaxID=2751370 RepID=UPI001AA036EE|nr:SCO1664 family protein [Rhabdothermincola sediminis]